MVHASLSVATSSKVRSHSGLISTISDRNEVFDAFKSVILAPALGAKSLQVEADRWLDAVTDQGVGAILVLGANTHGQGSERSLLTVTPASMSNEASKLANLGGVLGPNGSLNKAPLTWEIMSLESPDGSWQLAFAEKGYRTMFRITMDRPGEQTFEVCYFLKSSHCAIEDVGLVNLTSLGIWPTMQKAIAGAHCLLTSEERTLLRDVFNGTCDEHDCTTIGAPAQSVKQQLTRIKTKLNVTTTLAACRYAMLVGAL